MNRREQFQGSFSTKEMRTIRLGTALSVMLMTFALGSSSTGYQNDDFQEMPQQSSLDAVPAQVRSTAAYAFSNPVPIRIPLMVQPEGIPDRNPSNDNYVPSHEEAELAALQKVWDAGQPSIPARNPILKSEQ